MTKDEAKKFAECLLSIMQLNDIWIYEAQDYLLKMMYHPKIMAQIDLIAKDDVRSGVIALGLNIHPIHPDDEEKDVT